MFDKAGLDSSDIFAKMQVGEPYRRYKKTILGKVFVYYLDPFESKVSSKLMAGNPRKNEDGCFFETWDTKGDMFFRNSNKDHFKNNRLIEVSLKKEVLVTKTTDDMTDEQMTELVNARGFVKLQQALNKMVSIPAVSRLYEIAEQQEKSDKILSAINKRLSELQRLQTEGSSEA